MEAGNRCRIGESEPRSYYMQKFRLYETRSRFYMIGRDKSRSFWRVLKIDREGASDLNVVEDSATYTEKECWELRKRIHDGNLKTGGLKFVTTCYGIIGFIKFLGPYYMLLITKRKKIGAVYGHTIYAIAKSEMLPIPNSTIQSSMAVSKDENRYKKLLCTMDLRKDFFFSYSYHVMCSLQKNFGDLESQRNLYETMFVWNEYLTRDIRNNLKNTLWTVALVYGFFKQVKLSVLGRGFLLTLIARRSRHYAGTRYLKRGVNERGKVANDVETEQIVEDLPGGCPIQISSVIQNRGSIPLFWSQETSRLNLKPDIILSKKDHKYEATRLHFENLAMRYGNPIVILNLIKTYEKKPRETVLRTEFLNAIRFINKGLTEENRLKFLQLDLHKHSKNKGTNALALLGKVAKYALNLTGIFYWQVAANSEQEGTIIASNLGKTEKDDCTLPELSNRIEDSQSQSKQTQIAGGSGSSGGNSSLKPPILQKGVLRTNCIDCLDRTNVAQYAYGLVSFGRQLHALGILDSPKIDLDNPLAENLMDLYESMGDTLALQYGGSAAHNKIFSERRGQWKAATQSQEFFRTVQRYYSNAYVDAEKQAAINVFLGYFQPQPGEPSLWEGRRHLNYADENARSFMKRSLSAGNIPCESDMRVATKNLIYNQPLNGQAQGGNKGFSESSPEISASESDDSNYRYTPTVAYRQLPNSIQEDGWQESDDICYDGYDDECNFTHFLDVDGLSSSANSCDEEVYERSSIASVSLGNFISGPKTDMTGHASASGIKLERKKQAGSDLDDGGTVEYTDDFKRWVTDGGVLFH
ncbi:phosphoinositide phosphatase SAC2-like isoform X1 [Syzygium oleosum]|uniref:phosphoinositide phosphatase SAC2-like isoform X1 n=1 Tax=Syzygium oleosum TaxID=219896 RepID=UPI0024B9618D|nr:phosphoinositide phosphatase SAC2-like isoform X1 [Syzygium oleosum]